MITTNVWVEVEYHIQITERGFAVMKIPDLKESDDPKALIAKAWEVARARCAEAMQTDDVMKIDDIKQGHKVLRFYFDDGTGNPNRETALDLDVLEEIMNEGFDSNSGAA